MTILLAVTVDADNDDVSISSERNALSWHALDLIPAFGDLFARRRLAATWFVRADNQLAEAYGRSDYLLARHADWWERFAERGDEIGWHPHVYRWVSDRWQAEWDEQEFVAKLRATWADLCGRGYSFQSVRIGEAFCSDAIMRTLGTCGLRADATAIPGRTRDDLDRRFDWGPTPNQPYRPSLADYRVGGAPAYANLVEVPLTTLTFQARYDSRPLLRYVNPAYHPPIFRDGIDRYLGELDRTRSESVLTMVIHPDEALAHSTPHGLYAYSLDAVEENLAYLLEAALRAGMSVRSVTIEQLASATLGASA